MTFTHSALGFSFVVAVGSTLLGVVLPDVKPIVVHSLAYSDGVIHQERTVRADGDLFYATWRAEIEDSTGLAVCSGQGAWNYKSGYLVADMSVDKWTGDATCSSKLKPGVSYTPVASWFWGSDQTSKRGAAFTID